MAVTEGTNIVPYLFAVGTDIYDDRKMMAFAICLSFVHIIETVLEINSILNQPGTSLFIALFPFHCNCTYKILILLIEIISKLFVLQFVYGLTLNCSPLWEFHLSLFMPRVSYKNRVLLLSNACLLTQNCTLLMSFNISWFALFIVYPYYAYLVSWHPWFLYN